MFGAGPMSAGPERKGPRQAPGRRVAAWAKTASRAHLPARPGSGRGDPPTPRTARPRRGPQLPAAGAPRCSLPRSARGHTAPRDALGSGATDAPDPRGCSSPHPALKLPGKSIFDWRLQGQGPAFPAHEWLQQKAAPAFRAPRLGRWEGEPPL